MLLIQIAKTVEEEFGESLQSVFEEYDEEALAAASIAQVHRATLTGGLQVAVKVQHRGIKPLLEQDFYNLAALLSWIQWAEPTLKLKDALEEWAREMIKELSFKNEAENTAAVSVRWIQ